MIGRKSPPISVDENVKLKSFDDFDLRLGDMMRGERATLGKSLLDVQRELRIKAAYIAAIENSDPSAFDTPGFIAGYVRSYARYLNMEPDEAFVTFCQESGFSVAHGMSEKASVVKASPLVGATTRQVKARDPFLSPNTPFIPGKEGFWSEIEPRAVGSTFVLLALIAGIGYGGWSVLKEIQQVQFAPVDQAPVMLSDLDPLSGAIYPETTQGPNLVTSNADALDRLYRPQALDVPVLVARDAPIATLDPREVGSFRATDPAQIQLANSQQLNDAVNQIVGSLVPQVVEHAGPPLQMVAVRPSWVRVRAADGTVIFEGIMESGETYDVPMTEEPPTLRAGESGAIYFATAGSLYGPVGDTGTVTSKLPLSIATVTDQFAVADLDQDRDLARMVAEAKTSTPQP